MLRLGARRRPRDRPVPRSPRRARGTRRACESGVTNPSFEIVVPTLARPSLGALVDGLGRSCGPLPERVWLVLDAADTRLPPVPERLKGRVDVIHGPAAGPAAARNAGWRAARAEWIVFLDDDVVPHADWLERLAGDLAGLEANVAGSQGRLHVPLPADRRPTDWERNVKGLEAARWATADMAFRRSALAAVGGFDERFERAYREDADLALRVLAAGYRLVRGERRCDHPVGPADRWTSVTLQAGNADDALMDALHGSGWQERVGAAPGRFRVHLATTAVGVASLLALALGRRRVASLCAAGWFAGIAELAWARIAPGPRTADEVATMVVTSALLPVAAVYHRARGIARARRLHGTWPAGVAGSAERPGAVLFDRDGTLVQDVPYNGDPGRVTVMPGAREAVDRLRAAGIPTAVVSNQSGVARGLLTREQVEAVNRRIESVLGPLGPWLYCTHGPDEGCGCRKPAPGLVLRAAETLGVAPERCVVVGDIGSDVEAARAAGARAILVPTERTRRDEVAAADEVAPDLPSAVERLLGGSR
ncbi:MAG: HAD-IIIA family hydrolase [Thermoleophilia bacterium]|nr:HAD-IIIA family hydrolase [Thermoleophilia bacterium]